MSTIKEAIELPGVTCEWRNFEERCKRTGGRVKPQKANKSKLRATEGESHPEAKKLKSLQVLHAANRKRLQQAGLSDVFGGEVPVAANVARARTEVERIRKLAARGPLRPPLCGTKRARCALTAPDIRSDADRQ